MPHGSYTSRVLQLAAKTTAAFRVNGWTLNQTDIDPDGLRHVATMSVRGHWFIIAVLLFELVYRPYLYFGVDRYATYALPILALIGFNGYINYRLLSNRRITWHSILALYALDIFLISVVTALNTGFSHTYLYLFYFPALAGMAMLFTSFWLNMVWVTMASLVYVAISLTVGDANRHRGRGREGVAGQDSRHVCGRCGGQPGNQVRADQVEAGCGARACASA